MSSTKFYHAATAEQRSQLISIYSFKIGLVKAHNHSWRKLRTYDDMFWSPGYVSICLLADLLCSLETSKQKSMWKLRIEKKKRA